VGRVAEAVLVEEDVLVEEPGWVEEVVLVEEVGLVGVMERVTALVEVPLPVRNHTTPTTWIHYTTQFPGHRLNSLVATSPGCSNSAALSSCWGCIFATDTD